MTPASWRLILAASALVAGTFTLVIVALLSADASLEQVTTDKPEYFSNETAIITGSGFAPGTNYDVPVIRPDGSIVTGDGSATPGWDSALTDGSGSFTYFYQLDGIAGIYDVRVYLSPWSGDLNEVPLASVTFADPAQIRLEQCRNGPATTPNDCAVLGGGTGWTNGNVGNQQGHLVEGQSIPYRAVMEQLPTNTSITVELGYDIKHSGAHAIDFLTHYQRLEPHSGHSAETVFPTSGVSGIDATTTTIGIPTPSDTTPCTSPVANQPSTRFNSLPAGERLMTLFGGSIIGISYVSEGCLTDSQAQTKISVTFTVVSPDAVLAWGGHIARALDWGSGNSAGGISGAPYHMRLISWSLSNIGQQDRSLSAGAVAPAGTIIINKTCIGGDDTFSYTTSDGGLPANFDITCISGSGSQAFATIDAGAKTVTEDDPTPAFDLTALDCVDPDNGSTTNLVTRTATIDLDPGETVTCTFTNTEAGPPPTPTPPPVGGVLEVLTDQSAPFTAPAEEGPQASVGTIAVFGGGLVLVLATLMAGAWYAWSRWSE